MTQNKELKSYLLQGHKITQPEAMRNLLIGRLASRINDLRNMGLAIQDRFIEYQRADGKMTRIKEYWLNTETK